MHTFSATLNTAGMQSITVADTVNSAITGSQSGIAVTAATLDQLFEELPVDLDEADVLRDLPDTAGAVEQVAVALADRPVYLASMTPEPNCKHESRKPQ